MPNLLKKLMTRSSRHNRRNRPAQDSIDLLDSPPPSAIAAQPPNDLDALAAQVMSRLKTQGQAGGHIDKQQVLDALHDSRQAEDPDKPQKPKTLKSKTGKLKKMAFGPEPTDPKPKRGTDDGRKGLESLIASIEKLQADGVKGQLSDKVLGHCLILLEAQRDELKDAMVYAERGRYPALKTLKQVYDRILAGLSGLESLTPTEAKAELNTLVQLLEEAPDYLIDTFLIELVIHHAETLDTTLASEVRRIHDEAVAQPGDLKTFRRAAEGIVAYACATPSEDLDDELSREAYRTIGKLVKQLKLRVDSGEQAKAKAVNAANTTSMVKPSSDDNLQALAASALESRFGTGPMPTEPAPPRARVPSPAPSAASDSSLDSVSLYEYRNQILTASALDLIMRQEALAVADSTGQYAGDVSWDDLRKAWIPKNVIKLKDTDLAPGEVPNNNPDDFEIKDEDDFGKKIGWTDRHEMYYKDDNPKFEV